MNGKQHFLVTIGVVFVFWIITGLHPLVQFRIMYWFDGMLSVPFVTFAMVVSDVDRYSFRYSYQTIYPLGQHRSFFTHSILPMLPFIIAILFMFPRLPTGLACLVLGAHLLCDLRFDPEKMKGYWQINFAGKRLGEEGSWLWLIGHGTTLIIIGIGVSWL